MSNPPTDPAIENAIRRLRQLGWKVAAKEVDPGLWVVDCEGWGFGFFERGPTAREAWLAALKKAEQYAKQQGGY